MPIGILQSLTPQKGFGFIRPLDGGADLFFHRTAVQGNFDALELGQRVEYVVDETSDKPRAVQVIPGTKGAAAGFRGKPSRQETPSHQGRGSGPYNRPGTRTGQPTGLRPNRFEERRPPANRPPEGRRVPHEYGFVTKLDKGDLAGYISSVNHGPELVFLADDVIGEKTFSQLRVGDYVRFQRAAPSPYEPEPVAKSVMHWERDLRPPKTQLPKHQKARGKKPSWR